MIKIKENERDESTGAILSTADYLWGSTIQADGPRKASSQTLMPSGHAENFDSLADTAQLVKFSLPLLKRARRIGYGWKQLLGFIPLSGRNSSSARRFERSLGRRVTAEGRCCLPIQIKPRLMKYACSVQVCKSFTFQLFHDSTNTAWREQKPSNEHHCKKEGLHWMLVNIKNSS